MSKLTKYSAKSMCDCDLLYFIARTIGYTGPPRARMPRLITRHAQAPKPNTEDTATSNPKCTGEPRPDHPTPSKLRKLFQVSKRLVVKRTRKIKPSKEGKTARVLQFCGSHGSALPSSHEATGAPCSQLLVDTVGIKNV